MCPIATSPGSACSCCSLKTCATSPMSRSTVSRPPSETAIPADSWPRCCSAKSAKYESRATSRSTERMPKTPHIRRSRSQTRPEVGRAGRRGSRRRRPRRSAAPRRRSRAGRSRPARPGSARITWPQPSPKRPTASSGRSSRAPTPECSAASASATARPPSETSWASEQRGAAAVTNRTSAASAARSSAGGVPETVP